MKKEVKPKTEQEKAQEFAKAYQELCNKHKYRIVVNPAFQARDDGTWSVVLQHSVGPQPRQQN